MQAQWEKAVGVPGNGRRRVQASPRVNGLFTRGSAGGGPARAALQDRPYGLQERIPVRAAIKPYADTPYEAGCKTSKAAVCPGCAIVPPRGMRCDQCWG